MAMTIKNNPSALSALNQLNKNNATLNKSLSKVSSGMKIVRAGDDSSAYAISERMRVQIRSLDQNRQNVQNGSTMLKIAHGGIQEIVDELRTLKELAINAANDSNTNEDRAIIQKEFSQRIATIDELATWTNYNTKSLLDGTYANSRYQYVIGSNSMADAFSEGSSNCQQISLSETGYGHNITPIVSFIGNGQTWQDSPLGNVLWTQYDDEGSSSSTDIAVKMDFSTMNSGFSILCGGCNQYINIAFDYSIGTESSTRSRQPDGNTDPIVYNIGVSGIGGADELAKYFFEGVKAINTEDYITTTPSGAEVTMLDLNHNVNLLKMNDEYFITKQSSPALCIYNGLINAEEKDNNPFTVHQGSHANQSTNFFINDMHTRSLGIDKAQVVTRQKATSAIAMIDEALEYALSEATYIGSYLQRLDYTEANIITENENVQGAESTIRDADMAKEMTEYTRQNILSQAAQSMLAQANQNSSGILGLLQ